MKPLEIDMDKLTAYIVDECPHVTQSDSGTKHCRTKIANVCNLPGYLKEDCPEDCPRRFTDSTRCDGAACGRVVKVLRKLKKDG